MSTVVPSAGALSPTDCGWLPWDQLITSADGEPGSKVAKCSLYGCEALPVAVIRRAPSGPRPASWQPYCRRHAYDRGVEPTADGLAWTAEFVVPRHRARTRRLP